MAPANSKNANHPSKTAAAAVDPFLATLARITPNPEQVKARVGVLTALEQLVMGTFNGQAQLALVGSSAAGTELVSSDLDVTVTMPTTDQLFVLRALLQQIQWATTGGWQQYNPAVSLVFAGARVEAIEAARIPIIKVTISDGTLLDISFNQPLAIGSAQLVHGHINLQPYLAPLCRLVKHWVERRELPSARHGGLGSYAWVLLVIFATQLDAKEKTGQFSSSRSLQQMLASFFESLGRFDYSTVLSVRSGQGIAKEYRWHRPGQLPVVEDPADASNNVAANISEATWVFLRAHFLDSAAALATPGLPQDAHDALFSNAFTSNPAIGLHPGQLAVYACTPPCSGLGLGLGLGRVLSVAPKPGWTGDFVSRWDLRSSVVVEPYLEEETKSKGEPEMSWRVYRRTAVASVGEAPGRVHLVPSQVVCMLQEQPGRSDPGEPIAAEPKPNSSDDAGQGEQQPQADTAAAAGGGGEIPCALTVSGRAFGLLCHCEAILDDERNAASTAARIDTTLPLARPAPVPGARSVLDKREGTGGVMPGGTTGGGTTGATASGMVIPEPRPRASGKRGNAMLIETPHSKKRRVAPGEEEATVDASPTPFASSPPMSHVTMAMEGAVDTEEEARQSKGTKDEAGQGCPHPESHTPSAAAAGDLPAPRSAAAGMDLTPCVNDNSSSGEPEAQPRPAFTPQAAWGGQRPLRLPGLGNTTAKNEPLKNEGPKPLPVNAPKAHANGGAKTQGYFGKGTGRKGQAGAVGAMPPAPRPRGGRGGAKRGA